MTRDHGPGCPTASEAAADFRYMSRCWLTLPLLVKPLHELVDERDAADVTIRAANRAQVAL